MSEKLFSAFRENMKTKDEKYKEWLEKAPMTCTEGGSYCTTFTKHRSARKHRLLFHSKKYRAEECPKCKNRFETLDEMKHHGLECPGMISNKLYNRGKMSQLF